MTDAYADATAVAIHLNNLRVAFTTEDQLQTAIHHALAEAGLDAVREVRLSDGLSRIDVLVDGRIGIEVKIDGSWTAVTRQLTRYAHCAEIDALILVTSRAGHNRVPLHANGKPIILVSLIGAGL